MTFSHVIGVIKKRITYQETSKLFKNLMSTGAN